MKDRLSKYEIRKDVVQESVDAVASTVGEVTSIIVNAVKEVSSSIGGLATDAFAIRDGARRAHAQLGDDEEPVPHRTNEPDAEPE
jgi:K+/H+ antiporter YhaU regulatory subunit KhtT